MGVVLVGWGGVGKAEMMTHAHDKSDQYSLLTCTFADFLTVRETLGGVEGIAVDVGECKAFYVLLNPGYLARGLVQGYHTSLCVADMRK